MIIRRALHGVWLSPDPDTGSIWIIMESGHKYTAKYPMEEYQFVRNAPQEWWDEIS